MSTQPHILVVDDDHRIRKLLRRYLAEEGFKVSEAPDGEAMRAILMAEQVDLVLLDLVMPGEDGLSLARRIRHEDEDIPIIILTGKGDLIDRVAGLEAGADDYLAKPFHLREVLARIRTVLRRARVKEAAPSRKTAPSESIAGQVLGFQGWRLDLQKRELRRPEGDLVQLTTSEFELLRAFATSANRVLNRDQLMDLAKGREWAANDRAIDTQVGRLRKKIEREPANPELIKTVRGAGYVFAVTVRPS
jgi:two-component system phosphate regulon response regulator OmpR